MSHEQPLTGKVAVVTGASRGIGFAIAQRLGQMGARVSICGRDAARLEESAATLRVEGIEVISAAADVAREGQIVPFVQKTQKEFGPIDILVNNAGIGLFGP